jgi:hypothetical protein
MGVMTIHALHVALCRKRIFHRIMYTCGFSKWMVVGFERYGLDLCVALKAYLLLCLKFQ